MTRLPPEPLRPTPPPVLGRASGVIGVVTLIAPVVGLLLKLLTGGLLMFLVITFGGLVLLAGYGVLVVAVARDMIPAGGSLRVGPTRRSAMVWALLTSAGIVVLGLTLLDADHGGTRSTLTWMLGVTGSESSAHDASAAIASWAAGAWLLGYGALVLTWALAPRPARGEGPLPGPLPAGGAVENPGRVGPTGR